MHYSNLQSALCLMLTAGSASPATPREVGPAINPGPPGWKNLGCYTDSDPSRTLVTQIKVNSNSVSDCLEACSTYQYAGVEDSEQCFCGTVVSSSGSLVSDDQCTMPCTGNSNEACGGAWHVQVYQQLNFTPTNVCNASSTWTALGCYTDPTSDRVLKTLTPVTGGSSNNTIEGCQSACQAAGYTYAGVEFAFECFCDNQIHDSGHQTNEGCDTHCTGNPGETCGGGNHINIYHFEGANCSASSSPPFIVTTTDGISISVSTANPTATTTNDTSSIESAITTSTSNNVSLTGSQTSVTSSRIPSLPTSGTSLPVTTTTSSSSTDVPSLTTTPTATSSTSEPKCVPDSNIEDYGYTTNGGFEAGMSPWTVTSSQGQVDASVNTDGFAYAECAELTLIPRSSATNNEAVVSQQITGLARNDRYILTLFQGRQTSDSTPETGNPTITVTLGSQRIIQFQGCGGAACNVGDENGGVYQGIFKPFVWRSDDTSAIMAIDIVWNNPSSKYAPLLLDGISIASS